jgi:type II secretion system protein H
VLIDRKVVKASMQICVIQSSRYSARNALRSGAEGFTLLEILIVLFIVAVMSGVVVANLPSFARAGDFDTEARRLKTLLDLARLEAQVQTAEFGFKPSHDSYEFLVNGNR